MKTSTTNFIEKYNEFWDNKKNEEKEMETVISEQEDEKESDSNSSNNTNSEDENNLYNRIDIFADHRESIPTDVRRHKKKKIKSITVQIIDTTTSTE